MATEQPERGKGVLRRPMGIESSRDVGGERRPDRRSRAGVYISEQMAFIYILQTGSSLVVFVSSLFLFVRFVNGSYQAL